MLQRSLRFSEVRGHTHLVEPQAWGPLRADLPWLSGAMSPDHAAVNPKGLPGLAAFRPPRGLGGWYTAPPYESCSRSPYVTGT